MNLYCSFVRGGNHSFVFQNERPSGGSARHESTEAETIRNQAEIVGADPGANLEQVLLHEENVRLEQLRQNKFQERVSQVRELNYKWVALISRSPTLSTVERREWDALHTVEYEMIFDAFRQLGQQLSDELGLDLDIRPENNTVIEVKGGGLFLTMSTLVGNKLHETYVGFRPDGTYEKLTLERFEASVADQEVAQGRNPNETWAYFDSRTNASSQYNLPGRTEETTISEAQFRDRDRFRRERGNNRWPTTE